MTEVHFYAMKFTQFLMIFSVGWMIRNGEC